MADIRSFPAFPPRDGTTCVFCGDTDEGAPDYQAFWREHESRAHKLQMIRDKAESSPVLVSLVDYLLEGV
jgi:hypothetical protein